MLLVLYNQVFPFFSRPWLRGLLAARVKRKEVCAVEGSRSIKGSLGKKKRAGVQVGCVLSSGRGKEG